MISLRALDVGFDPRHTGHIVRIEHLPVLYTTGECPHELHQATHQNDIEHVGEALAGAGYTVVVARTPNGRDVQCSPPDNAPHGYGSVSRSRVAWAVQAKRDNYWCRSRTLAAALKRAGWRRNEITPLWEDEARARKE